jgi:hypothetical protein
MIRLREENEEHHIYSCCPGAFGMRREINHSSAERPSVTPRALRARLLDEIADAKRNHLYSGGSSEEFEEHLW